MKQAEWMSKAFKAYISDEQGASAIEYGLIAALIGVGIIGGLNAFGNSQSGAWQSLSSTVQTTIQ